MKIGYIKPEFEPPQPDGRGGGECAEAGRGEGGRGRGRGPSPEDLKLADERRQLLNDALDAYRKAGATLVPMELPATITRALGAIGFVLSTEAAAAFDDLTRSPEIKDETLNTWPNTFRAHRFVPAVEYIRAQRIRTLLIREMDALMSQYDVFLSPATGSASLGLTNLTGHPAVALRAGFVANAPSRSW